MSTFERFALIFCSVHAFERTEGAETTCRAKRLVYHRQSILQVTRSFRIINRSTRVFAIKIIQPITPWNLKKAKFIRASLCVCDERIAEIAFEASISLASFLKIHQITKKY